MPHRKLSAIMSRIPRMMPEDDLGRLTKLIRTGLDHDGTAEELSTEIAAAIAKAETRYPPIPPALLVEDAARLRLCTLKAESFYQKGQYEIAVETLAPVWAVLKPRLDRTPTTPLQPGARENAGLLRQQLWALLHYVFYKSYALDGHPREAVAAFTKIKAVILAELTARPPSGTLAMCDYFIGQAYRAQRNFPAAEAHFLNAQMHIQDRIDRKIKEHSEAEAGDDTKRVDLRYELAFKNVFCARVMSGLSWLAMQEGRLTRAETFLRTALAILVDTHQESLKMYIEVLLWISILRKAHFHTAPDADEPLHGLAHAVALRELQRRMDEGADKYRCAGELARGYLDLAEFHPSDKASARGPYFAKAEVWLALLAKATDAKNTIHYHLLTARYYLLNFESDKAESAAAQALQCAKRYSIEDEHSVELFIMSALCHRYRAQAQDERREMDTEFRGAEGKLTQALDEIHSGQLPDPVLEGECYVLQAQIALDRAQWWVDQGLPTVDTLVQALLKSSEERLQAWHRLSQFVENYYLHKNAQSIRASINALNGRSDMPGSYPTLPYDFEVFSDPERKTARTTIKQRRDEFEQWMWDSFIERHENLTITQKTIGFGCTRDEFVKVRDRLEKKRSARNRKH